MYHELQQPGRNLCYNEEGYLLYVVTELDFTHQMNRLRVAGWRGLSVGEALTRPDSLDQCVVLTFDDGCETDLIYAAPRLREMGFHCTFYIVAGWVDRPGFLSQTQLLELAGMDFEIGCHSMTHAFLTESSAEQQHSEIFDSKHKLEQLLGRSVDHFSCPGGRWNQSVAQMVREAGYRSMATSEIGMNSARTNPFCLSRQAIMRDTTLVEFDRFCRGEGMFQRRARKALLDGARKVLGESIYEKVRTRALKK